MADWKYGLCGCFSNCGLSVFTLFCPCVVFGRLAEGVGEHCGKCGFCFLVPIASVVAFKRVREQVRMSLNIQATSCDDILMGVFCAYCATVQMAAEANEVLEGDMERE